MGFCTIYRDDVLAKGVLRDFLYLNGVHKGDRGKSCCQLVVARQRFKAGRFPLDHQLDGRATLTGDKVGHGVAGDKLAAVYDTYAIAKQLHLLHVVTGVENGKPVSIQSANSLKDVIA